MVFCAVVARDYLLCYNIHRIAEEPMKKPTKTADELKSMIVDGFWPTNGAPTINVFSHPTIGWDITIGSSRYEAFNEASTVANFLRGKFDIEQPRHG